MLSDDVAEICGLFAEGSVCLDINTEISKPQGVGGEGKRQSAISVSQQRDCAGSVQTIQTKGVLQKCMEHSHRSKSIKASVHDSP